MQLNTIGADTRGKQELDPAILRRVRVIVDDLRQTQELDESQHALQNNLIWQEDVTELSEIVADRKSARVA